MSLNYCFSWNFALRNWTVQVESVQAAIRLRWVPTDAPTHAWKGRVSVCQVCALLQALSLLQALLLSRPWNDKTQHSSWIIRGARPESRAFFNISFCLGPSHLLVSKTHTRSCAVTGSLRQNHEFGTKFNQLRCYSAFSNIPTLLWEGLWSFFKGHPNNL